MNGLALAAARSSSATVVVSDALRAAHEPAELGCALGDLIPAWHTVRAANEALNVFGDPEAETEPDSWCQPFVLFGASLPRRLGPRSHRLGQWLCRAEGAAEVAADLVFESRGLPIAWGFAADEQRVGVTLDRAEVAQLNRDNDGALRLVRLAHRRLDELEANWRHRSGEDLSDRQRLQVRIGLLATARAAWRSAVLMRDRERANAARSFAWSRTGWWTTPTQADKPLELDRINARVGLPPLGMVPDTVSLYRDRRALWARSSALARSW